MRHNYIFEFANQDNEYILIGEKLGRNSFKESILNLAQWNLEYEILSWIPYQTVVFMSLVINRNNVEVYINIHYESREGICDKRMQYTNLGPENGAYDDILLIASYMDKKKDSCYANT